MQQLIESMENPKRALHVGMLLSCANFEGFYGDSFGLTKNDYLNNYRNDFSWDYARGLAKSLVKVTILLPSWREGSLHQVEPNIQVRFLPIKPWGKFWEAMPWLARTPPGRYIAEVGNAAAFWPSLQSALTNEKINILYVQEYWTGRFDFLTRQHTPPIIAADHGGRKNRQITVFKKSSFQKAAAITCQTQDEFTQVTAFGVTPQKLPNGVDTEYFIPDETVERESFVFTVGRFHDGQKRISDLICALERLQPPWRLVIAGTGPDEEKLKNLSAAKELQSRIDFLGFITDKKRIVELYRRCGVFAMASAYEGLPMAVLEAMACGAPVVVTDIRAFQDVVSHDREGLRVEVGDVKAIAQAIDLAFSRRAAFSKAARKTIEQKFSMAAMVATLIALFEQYRT